MESHEDGDASGIGPKGIDIELQEMGDHHHIEQHSIFQKVGSLTLQEAVPVLPKCVAVFCFVFNILFPGFGTAIAAFSSLMCPCEKHMSKRWSEVFMLNIIAAILQLVMTMYILIGYFWGIWWGIIMIQRAPSYSEQQIYKIKLSSSSGEYVNKT
eukprot:Seg5077.5 transcript_id=Seg5077.5/GoldUCD/mRNA.D3Y31 product="Protein stum" protein_id=Seg5077.5/GoldUCD/D3Y31